MQDNNSNNILKVKLDIIFKKLFSENLDLLADLLASLLSIPVETIENLQVKNSEILPDNVSGKFVRMDLNIEVKGKLINIEMQYGRDYYYKDRTLFYWSKLYSGELQRGDKYKDLKPAICINIVDFSVFDCEEYHSHFTMMEKNRHEILTDNCAIHFFELDKIGKNLDKNNKKKLWLQLINAETKEEFEMLRQTEIQPIQNAVFTIYQMSEDEKIREQARMREKALLVEYLNFKGAREEGMKEGIEKGIIEGRVEGIKEGIEKGKKEGLIKTASNLLTLGMPVETIIKVTGLSENEIKSL